MAETGQANPSESCEGVLTSECTGFAGLRPWPSLPQSLNKKIPVAFCRSVRPTLSEPCGLCALVIVICTCWACLTVDEGCHPEFENRRCFFRNHSTKETGPVHSPDGDQPPLERELFVLYFCGQALSEQRGLRVGHIDTHRRPAPPAVSSTPGWPTGSTADDTTACH